MLCWLGISTMSFQVSFFLRENMLLNVCGWVCECMCAYFFLPLVFRPVWHRAALLFPTAALLLAEADTSTLTDSRSRYGWLFTADINIHLVLFDQKFTESNIGVNIALILWTHPHVNVGPENPVENNVEKQEDMECGGLSPDHRECNGSRSSKQCKHRGKRERMEKEREREEQLKTHEEIQQEEIQSVHDGKNIS